MHISNAVVALQRTFRVRLLQGVLRGWQLHAKQHPLAHAKAVLHWQWLVHKQCTHWQQMMREALLAWWQQVVVGKQAQQVAAGLMQQKQKRLLKRAVGGWIDTITRQR